ncbi:MAG TPA: hypothetical protein VJT73_19050 [Polyangiaceae bacterium]|nr:hypothetical protein [Polyangiaceae bacterium]
MSKPMYDEATRERRRRNRRFYRARHAGALLVDGGRSAALGGLSGIAAGAVCGIIAGFEGALAGAVIGGGIGAVTGAALGADQKARRLKDAELDREIGVTEGNIGEGQTLFYNADRASRAP